MAWIMPATGVRAPERMLVAVRAIAPVAGSPPNSGETMFAIPCAVSSTFGLWWSRPMRSATTAESSDSIAPSSAIVIAGRKSVGISAGRNSGTLRCGSPEGMPPKRVPTVSIGACSNSAVAVPNTSTTIAPGTRGATRRSRIITTSATAPKTVASIENVPAECASTPIRSAKSEGTVDTRRPKKSRIWVLAISTAIPFVNPMTTGRGRYFTAVPIPVSPRITSRTPAIIVQHEQSVEPVRRDDPGDDDDERAGGPADLEPRSAERGDEESGDDRAVDALFGLHA
jgi:hypothetical protein